jgi:hypothetical protein
MLKKYILLVICIILLAPLAVAQQRGVESAGEPNPNEIGVDTAQQMLREVSVSKFEDPAFWYAAIPQDQGIIRMRRFDGGPMDKQPIPGEVAAGIEEQDQYVLGMKVNYFNRGHKRFGVFPVRSLLIEGICKTVSVWVVGRNFNHILKLVVADYFGNEVEITMGKLNFSGWKKLTVAIPPSLKQRDYHHVARMGIKIVGFRIETDPAESYGTYYVYFDGLRAVTDLFAEQNRDPDDLLDAW